MSTAPTILHAFAPKKGAYGGIWKVYLEAIDSDGDMEKIAVVIHQTGFGHYPTDWIVLKSFYREHLLGYLQWNTFSPKTSYLPEWTKIEVRVSIFDKEGNESNEVIFPLIIESGRDTHEEIILPPPFNHQDLPRIGYIGVDLSYPLF